MVPKEEMAALILGGPDVVQHAIEDRKTLMGQMVGTLYPSIVAGEIAQLQEVYEGMKATEVRK